jgi:hypothetical protein
MNQWQKLVKILESDKEKRKEIACALGYKDLSIGINKFITHVRNKTLPTDRLAIIAPLLDLDIEELETDYLETKRLINREKKLLRQIAGLTDQIYLRDNFQPYIYIETSLSRPASITIAALLGGKMKYIRNLPEQILDLSKSDQISLIRSIILAHHNEKGGKCFLFGDITGYVYHPGFNNSIKFSVTGKVIG